MWIRTGTRVLSILSMACFGVRAGSEDLEENISDGYNVELPTMTSWHVGLYTKTTKPYKQICGGTIVAKHVVITAAHCVSLQRNKLPASNFAVAAGKIYRPWNEHHDVRAQKSDVKEIKIPPRYQGSVANFQDDIAILILTKDYIFNSFVFPACLNFDSNFEEEHLKEGQLGKVVGWGLTGENTEASQVLQATTLPIVSIDKCIEQSPVSFRSAITGDKICAGYNNGTAVCRGDSGGGLVFLVNWSEVELAFLRGVVSTSPSSENKCNIYTWATFTHLSKHERFINSVVPDVEKSCDLILSNYSAIDSRFSGIDHNPEDDSGTCKCTKPYKMKYDGKIFDVRL